MHHQIVQYMKSKCIDVLCLQETKAKRTSYYMIDSFTFYTFSNASPDKQEHYGTGFALSPAAKRALLRTLPSSSKVAGISLHTGAGEFSVITGHAPHNQHTEETKQAFYDELNQLIEKVENRGPYLIMGDFNARIHGRMHDEDLVLGPHLYGKGVGSVGGELDNRSFLINCCVQNQLLVSNTWFKHNSAKQVTYREVGTAALPHASASWDPNLFAQLDLCLTPRRWRNFVRDVSSDPWANVDSDHFPLLAKVRLKLGARRQQAPRPRWDFHSASPRNIREMNEALEARLNEVAGHEDVSQKWDFLREVFVQAMDEHIPKYQFAPRKPWISQSTLDLITRRGVLRSQGDLQQVAKYNKDIKRSAKRDKKNWLEEQLQSNSWEPIKQLKKSFPTKMVRLEPSPSLGMSATATNADIYAAHLEQVQWAPAKSSGVDDLCTDLLPHAAPDIEEGPLTMAELIQAIKHLKSGKSAGQDNIPNEFWKNLSGKGLEALLDLFQDCWSHGKSPSSWKQSQVIGIFKKGCESDPSNFRPISLLQTCYKLYARVLAARLYAGLDPVLRDNQFGFRQGRSTSDAIFLVRRLQDLVDAKRNQVLHLLFLDWSKAFDTIKPAALHLALRRLKVPPTMCKAILDLTASPVFRVVVDGEAEINFMDGSKVPKATSVVYLGAVIDSQGIPTTWGAMVIGCERCRKTDKLGLRFFSVSVVLGVAHGMPLGFLTTFAKEGCYWHHKAGQQLKKQIQGKKVSPAEGLAASQRAGKEKEEKQELRFINYALREKKFVFRWALSPEEVGGHRELRFINYALLKKSLESGRLAYIVRAMAEQQRNFEAMLAGIGQATEALGRVASQTATQQQQLTEAMQRLTEAASQGAAQAARNSPRSLGGEGAPRAQPSGVPFDTGGKILKPPEVFNPATLEEEVSQEFRL
ncbi:unnamed protein product [Symbiodinium natans]|uniref:Reverse transcriptase domain-containing protein n=1 Tax=Symbiodinium natans TaxID=878477 RepID=A0A812MG11_9DINO|nr:unnamed protein product [Symbiodinium natans]